ncbi:helix-turn-helix domain-containing protein [Nonomuraea africana]|uniref:helix-turn-helix domain-containing protein n=1 Tax=Nonomuraea africana TaxID=46171 RepID=UPI0033C5B1AB
MTRVCDYAQGGGFSPQEQQRRERIRLEAAGMFAQGEKNTAIARRLRVTERSVERWRRAWREGGAQALQSKGPPSLPKVSAQQFARLEGARTAGAWLRRPPKRSWRGCGGRKPSWPGSTPGRRRPGTRKGGAGGRA